MSQETKKEVVEVSIEPSSEIHLIIRSEIKVVAKIRRYISKVSGFVGKSLAHEMRIVVPSLPANPNIKWAQGDLSPMKTKKVIVMPVDDNLEMLVIIYDDNLNMDTFWSMLTGGKSRPKGHSFNPHTILGYFKKGTAESHISTVDKFLSSEK